jgi:NAD(P)-dependent dehydrogenase (short-subunit alcohol dehydrogenase family)
MVVLITGPSGGLGSVLGATLVDAGMRVYGTRRHPAGREGEDRFPMLPMDVTDAGSVERCVKEVLGREGRIDVVIN